MLLKDDHEEKRRKSIKRERRKVREKGGKEAPMQMENIKMYEKTEKSEKTGKQKKFFMFHINQIMNIIRRNVKMFIIIIYQCRLSMKLFLQLFNI